MYIPDDVIDNVKELIKKYDLDLVIPENLEDYEYKNDAIYNDISWKVGKYIICVVFDGDDSGSLDVWICTDDKTEYTL